MATRAAQLRAPRQWRAGAGASGSRETSERSFAALAAAYVVGGLREIGEPAREALIVDLAATERGRGVGLYYAIRGFAVAGPAAVGGALWSVRPQLTFLVATLLGIAGTLKAALFLPRQSPAQDVAACSRDERHPWARLLETIHPRSARRRHTMRHSGTVFGLLVALAGSVAIAAAPAAKTIDFNHDAVGASPAGFEFARTGSGAPGTWVVRPDKASPTNHRLVQENGDPSDYRFPLAIVRDGTYRDVTLTVRARPISGRVDQGFGLVWRYRDADNYYVTRCNADEDNCTIYHVVDGRRRAFQNEGIEVPTNVWHTLKVDVQGDHFVVWLDGRQVLDAHDATFKEAGRIGLWTKADSVIQFDDLTIAGR